MSTEREAIAARLREARLRAGYETIEAAAVRLGMRAGTYRTKEAGERGLKPDEARRFARAFGVSYAWLMTGAGDSGVPLVGRVGAGAVVLPLIGDGWEAERVEAPPGATPQTVAVRVEGDSMRPVFLDGHLLYYDRRVEGFPRLSHDAAADLLRRDWPCVVFLEDGRCLVKILRRGSRPDLFDLHAFNADSATDVALKWAAPIAWTRPPS